MTSFSYHEQEDYLDIYSNNLECSSIKKERAKAFTKRSQIAQVYQDYLNQLPSFKSHYLSFESSMVTIGQRKELTTSQYLDLQYGLRLFSPWKKGPFNFFGTIIDSEWRSDLKWQRIRPWLRPCRGKVIADVGCHNGYFMFRMAHDNPKLVIGFDPAWKLYCNFNLLQRFAQMTSLCYEPFGVQALSSYRLFFDQIFCLGILYHHPDPLGILNILYGSLKKNGELIVDCQGIKGSGTYYLLPEKKYTRAKGFWFLPTLEGLLIWLKKTGFKQIHCFYKEPLSTDEQRSTTWASIASLKDFLDPQDASKTVEGYPAPWRFYVRAKK